jgi:hypothetical protein
MLGELYGETEQRFVLLFDRKRLDVGFLRGFDRLLAASYGPQEK